MDALGVWLLLVLVFFPKSMGRYAAVIRHAYDERLAELKADA